MKEIIFDIGHEETEELLKQTEKRIENVYRQAYKELKKKSDDYMAQFLKTDAEKRKAMQAGEITKEEYRQWRQSHLLTGRRWVSMQESIAKDLNKSNKIAASIINGHLPDVYAININWATYQLEHDFKIDTSFTLYDRQTMERLLRDDPDLLPWQAKINTPEDIRYQKRHLNSAMMQGILQGETIPQISERLASSPCRMNARNAVTNARTMYTSAQNGGRIDGYKRAEGMGIHLKKQWLATLDGRTRHEHRQLDGQIVGTDESFEVDGYEIEFPGDPKAAAEMVYNCRCTMRSVLDALDKGGYTEYEKNGKLGDMTYEEWKNEHSKKEQSSEYKDIYEEYNANSEKIKQALSGVEEKRRSLDYEVGTIVDRQGNLIKEIKGEDHSVSVDYNLEDLIFTHNHPGGGNFSEGDIKSMLEDKLLELRASTPQGTYFSLRRTSSSTYDLEFWEEYKKNVKFTKAMNAVRDDIISGKLPRDIEKIKGFGIYTEYMSKLADDFLTNNAEKYGYIYSKGVIK